MRGVVSVSAGSTHTCAALDDATLRCWGSGSDGRLGGVSYASSPESVSEADCDATACDLSRAAASELPDDE